MITDAQYQAMKAKLPAGMTDYDLQNKLKARGLLPQESEAKSTTPYFEGVAQKGLKQLGGIAATILEPAAATVLPVFKKLNEFASYAAGQPKPVLTPSAEQSYRDIELGGYRAAPSALGMIATGVTRNPAVGAKVAAGGRALENFVIDPLVNKLAPGTIPTSETPITDVAKEYINFRALALARGKVSGAATFAGLNALNRILGYQPGQETDMRDASQDILASGILGGLLTPAVRKALPEENVQKSSAISSHTVPPDGGGGGSLAAQGVAEAARQIPSQLTERMSGLSREAQKVIKGAPEEVTALQKNYPRAKIQTINNFDTALNKVEAQVQETGPYYKQFRESGVNAVFNQARKADVLAKAGLEWVSEGLPQRLPDGTYNYPGHLRPISTAKAIALQPQEVGLLENWWKNYGAAPELRADAYLTGRMELAKFGKYDKGVPLGGESLRAFADALYSVYSEPKNVQPNMSSLAAADTASGPLRSIVSEAKKALYSFNKATGEYEISDQGITKLLNGTTGFKRDFLNKIEAVQPGVSRQLRILNAVNEIMTENKPGQYQKTVGTAAIGAGLGSVIPGLGTILGGAAGWFIGNLMSSPALWAEALKAYGKKYGVPLDDAAFKMERGIKLSPVEAKGVKSAINNMKRVYEQSEKTHKSVKTTVDQMPQKGAGSQQKGVVEPSPTTLPETSKAVNMTDDLANLTPEEKATGLIGGSDSVKGGMKDIEFTVQSPITVYRGEGKGIGNSTFVNGQYFADSKKFASTFGKVTKSEIPTGTRVFDFDAIKNNPDQTIVSQTLLVDPPSLTKYLIDKGYGATKNTNSRGVEYVLLNKQHNELVSLALKSKSFNDFTEKLLSRWDEFRSELNRIESGMSEAAKTHSSSREIIWNEAEKFKTPSSPLPSVGGGLEPLAKERIDWKNLTKSEAKKMLNESKGMPKSKWERLWEISQNGPTVKPNQATSK